jgi:hypothetical protein
MVTLYIMYFHFFSVLLKYITGYASSKFRDTLQLAGW